MRSTAEVNNKQNNFIGNKSDNRGFSFLAVIVTIGFVAILGTLMLYLVSISYKIRVADVKNKDSFYSAEHALDEIKAGIEEEISDAMGEAYLTIMQNYNNYSSSDRVNRFNELYVGSLRNAYKYNSNDNQYNVAKLRGYLQDTSWNAATGVGAVVVADNDDYGIMLVNGEGITFRNLTVTYRAEQGSVSKINTDIKIEIPKVDFSEDFKLPDIASYCMIANKEIEVKTGSRFDGNAYAGADGIKVVNGNDFTISDSMIITDGEFSIGGKMTVNGNSTLWVNGISVNGKVVLDANVYNLDDLTVIGDKSEVTLSNAYYGYGIGKETEDVTKYVEDSLDPGKYSEAPVSSKVTSKNSSIVINGTNSKINMAGLNSLMLGGTAFIKSPQTNSVDGFDGLVANNKNVITGESMAAKGEQIAYLVPAECLLTQNGVGTVNTNPVVYEQSYIDFMRNVETGVEGYKEVDLSAASGRTGSALASYVNGYQKVYSNKTGVQLIYYYLTFANESNASSFFKVYFENNKDKVTKYLNAYISELDLPVDSMPKVSIAGNVLVKDSNGQYSLYSQSDEDNSAMLTEAETYYSEYKKLNTILSQDAVTSVQQQIKEHDEGGTFYNIVKAFDLSTKYVNTEFSNLFIDASSSVDTPVANIKRIYVQDGSIAAVIVHNTVPTPTQYKLSDDTSVDWSKVGLLIVIGDVLVDKHFEGIILSGGKIEIASGNVVKADETRAVNAMQLKVTLDDSGDEYMLVNLFTGGSFYTGSGSSAGGESVKTNDLIVYKNWKKE